MRSRTLIAALAAAVMLTGCSEPYGTQDESSSESGTAVSAESPAETTADSQPEEVTAEDSEGLYDTTPISDAYLTGDTSGLDELQIEIYELASAVLDDIITEEMTDYEKELAVHDHIVNNAEYDMGKLGIFEIHGEHAADPYGMLAEGKCICSGYTTTFQMFMDMLEIPCISIQASADGGEDHAWNMVEINGHWYYVDVTWDDPVPDVKGRPVQHKYFNASLEEMASRHEWDSSSDPVVDSAEDSYIAHELQTVYSMEDIDALIEQALEKGTENFYFEPADRTDWSLDETEGFDSYVRAADINARLGELSDVFADSHGDLRIWWQRMEFEGRIIVGGYLMTRG